jgi:hypothetical protein
VTIPARDDEFGRPVMQGPFTPEDREHWTAIPLQDFGNITRQQKGIHNQTFDATRISHVYEMGIANLHQEVDRYLAEPITRK